MFSSCSKNHERYSASKRPGFFLTICSCFIVTCFVVFYCLYCLLHVISQLIGNGDKCLSHSLAAVTLRHFTIAVYVTDFVCGSW